MSLCTWMMYVCMYVSLAMEVSECQCGDISFVYSCILSLVAVLCRFVLLSGDEAQRSDGNLHVQRLNEKHAGSSEVRSDCHPHGETPLFIELIKRTPTYYCRLMTTFMSWCCMFVHGNTLKETKTTQT